MNGNNKKTYYSISEVCARTGLEPHVLRYWESEFTQLRPKKNRAGNRAYRDKDIDTIGHIRRLLYEEQYTIPGAKKKLCELRDGDPQPQNGNNEQDEVRTLKSELASQLRDVLNLLQS